MRPDESTPKLPVRAYVSATTRGAAQYGSQGDAAPVSKSPFCTYVRVEVVVAVVEEVVEVVVVVVVVVVAAEMVAAAAMGHELTPRQVAISKVAFFLSKLAHRKKTQPDCVELDIGVRSSSRSPQGHGRQQRGEERTPCRRC